MRRSFIVLGVLAAAGMVSLLVTWRSLDDSVSVALQLPYAVSGAIGGVALLGFALGLIAVQASRRNEASERAQFNRLVTTTADLLADLRTDGRP